MDDAGHAHSRNRPSAALGIHLIKATVRERSS